MPVGNVVKPRQKLGRSMSYSWGQVSIGTLRPHQGLLDPRNIVDGGTQRYEGVGSVTIEDVARITENGHESLTTALSDAAWTEGVCSGRTDYHTYHCGVNALSDHVQRVKPKEDPGKLYGMNDVLRRYHAHVGFVP
ncbi:hypothetical protein BDN71DRAFT_1433287 [Pleurotus eryngii]|uniref:Uncharacterized protein n=1 Tax=Pleurotus eryngii TaxID=5323 RepID=A0A9P6D5Z0_PLEER|nr:hypothetical protein BDN71DRAFT_1433287 [Pleurotus eryngii]